MICSATLATITVTMHALCIVNWNQITSFRIKRHSIATGNPL